MERFFAWRIGPQGKPETIPFYPHEYSQRLASFGLTDHSALPVPESTRKDLNPLERERLRQIISRYGGEKILSELSDDELDGALGLTTTHEVFVVPQCQDYFLWVTKMPFVV